MQLHLTLQLFKICNICNLSRILILTSQKSFKKIKKMENITDIKFGPLIDSIYLKPCRMTYKQDGKEKFWDLMELHDSVAILLFNVTRKVFILVKQFRPGVYYYYIPVKERKNTIDVQKYPASLGITVELCAGIVDKVKSPVEIAKEEVLEECGYDVPLTNFQELHRFTSNVGTSGTVLTLFYCEVSDDMKIQSGGGIDDEFIEVIEMSFRDFKYYISKPTVILSPGTVLIGFYWFLSNRKEYCY